MNLFINPSLQELKKLVSQCDISTPTHNIVVDYDGEVLIDPDLQQPEIDLNRFKYRIQLREISKDYINRSSHWMRNLLNNLVNCWENNQRCSNIEFN
ncbi:MAG: hypothetical protein ABIT08_16515 [Bacteroidia bacterium]